MINKFFTYDHPTRFDLNKVIIREVFTKVYKYSKLDQRYKCTVKYTIVN